MKSRKIYYVRGLISAILIPLIFWYLGNRELQKPIPNVMDLGLIPNYNPNIPINQQISFELMRNFNYKKIIVKPNSAKKNSKFYVSEIKKLQARNESKTGIEFVLNDDNSYGDFASILNDFTIAKHDFYALDLDKTGYLFALTNFKDPNIKILSAPSFFSNDTIMDYHEPNFLEKIKYEYQLLNLPKQSYYIIFGYLILLNISILSLIKRQI